MTMKLKLGALMQMFVLFKVFKENIHIHMNIKDGVKKYKSFRR